MKRIIFMLCVMASPAMAATPSTSCPDGYLTVQEPGVTIATSCPSGTIAIGTIDSCMWDDGDREAICAMYAPPYKTFTDESGTYQFTQPCVLQ